MAKIYDITNDNLILKELYEKKLKAGDFDGALSVIRRMESAKIDKESIYFYFASTYFNAKIYYESINNWFKYLSVCADKKRVRAYNGLGACFFCLGDTQKAGYYFNLQMASKNKSALPYDEVLKDFYKEVTDVKKVYTLAYPYEKADFTNLLDKCVELTKASKYEEALKELEVIPKESKFYGQAVMQKAICHFFLNDEEKAVDTALYAIELAPKNATAICNAISILKACNLDTLTKIYVEELKKVSNDVGDDDAVKMIMILADVGDFEFAKKIADKYLLKNGYDVHVLYVLGIVEYNLKNFERAKELFLKNYRLTQNVVAKYYAKQCERAIEKQKANKRVKKLDFIYDVPDDEKYKIYQKLVNIATKKTKKFSEELKEICEYCFYTTSEKTAFLAIDLLFEIKSKESLEYLKQKLINASVYDTFKRAIISCFILDGFTGELSVVLGGKFKKINLVNVDFYGDNAVVFKSAYAYLVSQTCTFVDDINKLKESALEVYGSLLFSGNEQNVDDYKALAAVMFECSKIIEDIKKTELASFFSTSTKKVKKVRDLYLVAFNESEPLIGGDTKRAIEEIYDEE